MKRIGVIGAMEEEVEILKQRMDIREVRQFASMDFNSGAYDGRDVVIVRSGIGKVNAAVCTQILADIYEVDLIINTGVAGSLDKTINIGDIVLSTDALQHDVDATVFGYEPGVIPRMDTSVFRADAGLIELAKKICEKVNPQIGVHEGRVVSGDQFVSDFLVKERLLKTFGGCCTEMEGAAIAQTSYLNHIPFLIIRAISDKADGSAHMDYDEFEAKAIEHTVKLMDGLLRAVE